MEAIDGVNEYPGQCFEIRPNASLSPQRAVFVFLSIAATSLLLAIPLSLLGYWPILAFAMLELLIVSAGLRICIRNGQRLEVIRISPATIAIEKGRQRPEQHWAFSGCWTQIALTRPYSSLHAQRLIIRCRKDEVEIGDCLTDEDKQALAGVLKNVIGPVGTAPHCEHRSYQSTGQAGARIHAKASPALCR